MTNLNTDGARHIESLMHHGVTVIAEDGMTTELNMAFYAEALRSCRKGGALAITYSIRVPGVNELLALAVHADGRVDSGSAESILMCLEYNARMLSL